MDDEIDRFMSAQNTHLNNLESGKSGIYAFRHQNGAGKVKVFGEDPKAFKSKIYIKIVGGIGDLEWMNECRGTYISHASFIHGTVPVGDKRFREIAKELIDTLHEVCKIYNKNLQ